MQAAKDAGADFAVSPGRILTGQIMTKQPAAIARRGDSIEMMALMADGITAMKFFPASVAGGATICRHWPLPLLARLLSHRRDLTANST